MGSAHSLTPRGLVWATAIGLLIAAAFWIVAAPERTPVREEITVNDVPVVVEYSPGASPDDLGLPFHPGARLERGFTYKVTTKEGKAVTYYASAVLMSEEAPEDVGRAYGAELPGNPRPELIEDDEGERYVLAVGSDSEVRQVTIRAAAEGSRIELIRAFGVSLPSAPLRPRTRDQQVI